MARDEPGHLLDEHNAVRLRGPVTVALACVIPVLLWAASRPLGERFTGSYAVLMSLGVMVGLAGGCSFACNLVLGARFRPVDAYFGGLDKMFAFHRRLGEVAFALVACHALLIVASRASVSASTALALFSPAAGVIVLAGVGALALAGVTLCFTLFARLGHEVFVYMHRMFGVAFALATLHMLGTPGTPLSLPVSVYLAVLSTAGLVSWGYRSLFADVLVRRRDYVVTRVNQLGPRVVEIAMSPATERLRYLPGQFIYVTFYSSAFSARFHPVAVRNEGPSAVVTLRPGDARDQFHPFSLTSSPTERDLRITVKAVGTFTAALPSLDRGARARVEGPYGAFSHVRTANRNQVWIAGGIGITPFLSMARSLGPSDGHDVDLYYGVKDRSEAYFLDELTAIADAGSGLRLFLVPEDEQGFMTAALIHELTGDVAARDAFICGPPGMIDALRAQLEAGGVPRKQIHFEKFSLGQPRG
jgi:predicted ferric reductase